MSTHDSASGNRQTMENPYATALQREVAGIVERDVAAIMPPNKHMAHIKPDNDWIYPELAKMALALAYAWSAPHSAAFHRKEVWSQFEKLLARVLDKCNDGKWWRQAPGTGDDNINRFTLLPLLETFMRVGNRMNPELKKNCLSVIERAAAVQTETYHVIKVRRRGEYPNMDAYFMLIMEEAARILDRSDYHLLALDYLGYLETCLLPDGGFVYYKGTSECEVYHQINVMLIARLWELTHAARALELLRRTLPYYPNAVEPSGVVEYYTDPFWKHYWSPGCPAALDVLATLFPDAPEAEQHRYLANRIRDYAAPLNGMFLIWGYDYWRGADGVKPRDGYIRYDASIRGPRGRFGDFSWAGTTGVCVDTFVGAMIAPTPERVSALEAVGAEIILVEPPVKEPKSPFFGRRHGTSAYVSGHDYARRVIVSDDWACLAAWSPLFNGGIGWNEFHPDSGWQMRQVWWLNRQRLVGLVVVDAAHKDAASAQAVSLYSRWGGTSHEIVRRETVFQRGDLNLRVIHHTLSDCSVKPGYRFYLDAQPTSSEVVLSSPIAEDTSRSYMVLMEVFPVWEKPADIVPLPSGQGMGFKVSEDRSASVVMFNAHNGSVQCDALDLGGKSWGYRTTSGYPCTQGTPLPQGITVMASELMVACGIDG